MSDFLGQYINKTVYIDAGSGRGNITGKLAKCYQSGFCVVSTEQKLSGNGIPNGVYFVHNTKLIF